jgi:hypothetical protein
MQVFSLAQCFLWWWGKPVKNTERCAVIASEFCPSWGLQIKSNLILFDITAKCKRDIENSSPSAAAIEVPIQDGSRSLTTDKMKSNHVICTLA